MTTTKKISKVLIASLIHVFLKSNAYAQEKDLIRVDTTHKCFIVVKKTPYDYILMKKIDSLIKCPNDTSIVKLFFHSTTKSSIDVDYTILYKKNTVWQLEENDVSPVVVVNLPFDFHSRDTGEPKNVIAVCPLVISSSAFEKFYYFFVINKKIIKSYDANIPISVAIGIDKRLVYDLTLFEEFDKYLVAKKNK